MKYRITIDIAFATEDPIHDILDKLQDHWDSAEPINPGEPDQESAYIRLQECRHDETPPAPCVTTYYIQKPPLPPPPIS